MRLKSRFIGVCLIVLLAALFRILFFYQFWSSDFFDCPVLDMHTYIEQAQIIAKDGLRGLGVIWRPPLYPVFLSLSLKLGDGMFLPAMLVQVFLSSLSAGWVYLIARRFTSESTALTAAVLYAIHWISIFFSALFLSTSLFIFLLMLALWLLLVSHASRPAPLILSGLASGFAMLVRPEILPCVLGWAVWIAWRKRIAHAALFLAAVAFPILPIAIHNYRTSGQFVPITAIGGYNFFVGNNVQADGKTVWASKEALEKLAVSENLLPLDHQSHFVKATFEDILNHPARFIGLTLKKLYYLINSYEISSNVDIYYLISDTSPWLAFLALFPFGILFPFAVIGCLFGSYNRRAAVPVFLFVIPFALVLLAFFITSRFRSPMIPILCVFASLGASVLWREREKLLTSGSRIGLTLVFFLLLCNTRFFGVDDPRDNIEINLRQAFAFYSQQRIDSCRKILGHVLAVDPRSKPAIYLFRQLPEK